MSNDARYRLSRAGVLNVWQYDDQVFDFADGRLLLRGANGAGKSKTMEMLLPFVIDGDKSRLTASGRHHTSLLWLMLDGYDGTARTGYVWVEFTRALGGGRTDALTCGVGMRATASARAATAWYFVSPRRFGDDLRLENEAGPLSQVALVAELDPDGRVFDNARRFREHVGQRLFGLPIDAYEELLRLLYWLRQPQVGEEIDPKRLAEQLVQALPQVDTDTVRTAGDTFDELEAFGEQIEQRGQAAAATAEALEVYAAYARGVVAQRGQDAIDAGQALSRARRDLRRTERERDQVAADLDAAETATDTAAAAAEQAAARIRALEAGPEARSRQALIELGHRVDDASRHAETAARLRSQAAERAGTSAVRADSVAGDLHGRAQALHRAGERVGGALSTARLAVSPPPTAAMLLPRPAWSDGVSSGVQAYETAAAAHAAWAAQAVVAVRQGEAAVAVVDAARDEADRFRASADSAQRDADGAERRVEHRRREHEASAATAREAESRLFGELTRWTSRPHAVGIVLPELSADGLRGLEALVEKATAPVLAGLDERWAQARGHVEELGRELSSIAQRRQDVEAEHDPTPPPPAWRRDDRSVREGAPFWRLVDFRPGLTADERAGLESALEGSGLLDAWVHPEGVVTDRDGLDLVAVGEPPPSWSAGGRLGSMLQADPPPGSTVSSLVVQAVLDAVTVDAAAGPGERTTTGLTVTTAGRWRAGPLAGRTAKPAAQYVGATARAAERERRLAELDRARETAELLLAAARTDLSAADEAREGLRTWARSRPRHDEVLTAWSRHELLSVTLRREEAELGAAVEAATAAVEAATAARKVAAERHTALLHLAERHGLPITVDGLTARREVLRALAGDGDGLARQASALAEAVPVWEHAAGLAGADALALTDRSTEYDDAVHRRDLLHADLDERRRAEGAGVAELERALHELRGRRLESEETASRRAAEAKELTSLLGALGQRVTGHQDALRVLEPARDAAFGRLRDLWSVAGLVGAAVAGDTAPPNDRAEVTALVAAARPPYADDNAILQAVRDLQNGPAALNEPRLLRVGGVFAAVGRDDSGERSLTELAQVLAAGVAADRQLLTDRERELFENHVLGELGDALRGARRTADELVAAMNDQLRTVSTSQGIRVRLRWGLRDDIPSDARLAVKLLGQPLGALLPHERTTLRESLHRLIDLSRAEAPDQSYAEHLARALDYRQWHAFTVQYHRPETGDWRDLQRRSALSQGEQKVLCYLPLFAAAAAHFTSLAGAAPHAPRFVLLDDAFPKIDVRTHPLLFGLLVDLDLDFIVTSERLWGTHDTVPALAIYEALRNPAERGIAQYQHRWDGRQLTAVGA